eukprot:4889272-Pleurochrysis_carterae.AAC.1
MGAPGALGPTSSQEELLPYLTLPYYCSARCYARSREHVASRPACLRSTVPYTCLEEKSSVRQQSRTWSFPSSLLTQCPERTDFFYQPGLDFVYADSSGWPKGLQQWHGTTP